MASPLRRVGGALLRRVEDRLLAFTQGTGEGQVGGAVPVLDHRLVAQLLRRRNRRLLASIESAERVGPKALRLRPAMAHASPHYHRYIQQHMVVLAGGKSSRDLEVTIEDGRIAIEARFRSKAVATTSNVTVSLFPETAVFPIR